MYTMKQHLDSVLASIRSEGLYKNERLIATPQSAWIQTASGQKVLNLCANNYLGFANHPEIIKAAKEALDSHGFGLASVRFICGTQDLHKQLESKLSAFLGMEETILYSSCFDANGGLFETLLGSEDAIISDALNHASIIDGVRLCKAQRFRYANNDMADLETQLKAASAARFKLIATDGVFSMDGTIANVKAICDLAERYGAMVMVDDSHAVGFVGKTGRGSHEYNGVMGRVDIITGTFGKALGGAGGGYTSARKEIVELLRQRSRPYLFSNSLSPAIAGAAIKALDLLETLPESLVRLRENTAWYRQALTDAGFTIKPGEHPIVPIMLDDARLAQEMSRRMLEKGVYVVGFFYPVVPQGQARIRTQVSAAHTREDLAFAVKCFSEVRDALLKKA
jgi:glycine C-acetyltransferase